MRHSGNVSIAVAACAAALGCSHEVRPDDMSAAQHRAVAQKETREARREMVAAERSTPAADPLNGGLNAGIEPELYINPDSTTYRADEELAHAKQLAAHAREHELAAADLERSEAAECKTVPPGQRSTCPLLGPVEDVRDVTGGVRVRLAEGVQASDVLPVMRCHLAYARTRGLAGQATCPLYLHGVEFRATSDPQAIDIIGPDNKTISELRKRAHGGAELKAGSKG